jgi:hypothetical protein
MVRPKTIDGTRFIKIRVTSKFYKLIQVIAERLGIPSISEFCRSSLEIVVMGLFLKKNTALGNVEKEFMKKYGRRLRNITKEVSKA